MYSLPSIALGLFIGLFFNSSIIGSHSTSTVIVTELYDSLCFHCSSLQVHEDFIRSLGITPIIRRVDYRSYEGAFLVSKYGIKELPTIIISNIEGHPDLESVYSAHGNIETDGNYVFRFSIALDNFFYERFNSKGELVAVNTNSINLTGKQSRGGEEALVSVVIFNEFACESCNLSNVIIDSLLLRGDVKFYFKHYPLDSSCNSETDQVHVNSCTASMASECAAKQGKFWEYHDLLFNANDLSTAALKGYALQLGLNADEFNNCLDSNETLPIIMRDINEGFSAGVIGVPMFYVNNKPVIGLQPLSFFNSLID